MSDQGEATFQKRLIACKHSFITLVNGLIFIGDKYGDT